jgi:hypothetical protein
MCALFNFIQVTQTRMIKLSDRVTIMGEVRNVHKVLVGKPEQRRQFGTFRSRLIKRR